MPFINDMLESFQSQPSPPDQASHERDELPARSFVSRFTFGVPDVLEHLRRNILGQVEALSDIERILHLVRADIADPNRPLCVCLLVGPTGVGKTEVVQLLAEAIHGNRDALCRVDMNALSQEHYAASLVGAPPGYVGSKEAASLLDKEKIEGSYSRPGIVLFDEIEKASDTVLKALLHVFDNGMMTLASGQKTINFRNTMIFMTSNLAAREIQGYARQSVGFWKRVFGRHHFQRERVTTIVHAAMEKRFSPEFVNRIDQVVVFNPIDETVLTDILGMELERLNRRLERYGYRVVMDASLHRHLVDSGFDHAYGARSIRRQFRALVEVPVARYLVTTGNKDLRDNVLMVTWQGNEVHVRAVRGYEVQDTGG